MKKGRPKGSVGKARVLEKDQIKSAISKINILATGGRHANRNSAILATSYYLGLRAKELSGLNIKDISENYKIRDAIDLTVTKGGKSRVVYIPLALQKILSNFLSKNNLDYFSDTAPLFRSQKGSRFTPNTMQCLLKHIYTQCDLTGCSSHTGRRSFATHLIESGADIKAVSSLMGHASISMTAKYVEDNPVRLKNMVNTML